MSTPLLRDLLKQLPSQGHPAPGGNLLDLGCGLGEDLFDLFHAFRCAGATGVDLIPETYFQNLQDEEAEKDYLLRHGHPLPFHKYQFTAGVKTLYGLYERYVKTELQILPLDEAEWKKAFHFLGDTDVRNFVAGSQEAYSLVFCSGVLHWLKQDDQLPFLRSLQKCTMDGGLVALMTNSPLEGGTEKDGTFSYIRADEMKEAFVGWEILLEQEVPGRSYLIVRKPSR